MGTDALQAGLNAIEIDPRADFSQQLIAAKCRALLAGYDAMWSNAPYEILSVEELVTSELWNPDTGRKSRSFTLAGKIDVKATLGDRRVIFDHKTTSQDISDPNSSFWRQLTIEGQVSHYMLLEWLNQRKVDDAVWDVVRKPSISPKAISKKDCEGVIFGKRYFGREVSTESLLALQQDQRETLEMYEARLAHDCTIERPQWYFQRRSVPRLDAELHEYATELWGHSQDLLHVRHTGRHVRNPGACMLYGSPCKFLGICSGHDEPNSDHWQLKNQVHVELDLDGDGRDVLTNSRIRSFQTCRRKHYYEYEIGIERQDEEEREALFFGTLWHKALEAWFETQIEKGDVNGNNNAASPSSEVGTGCSTDNTPIYF
ncbi:MAG: PD-(D/E)XK nuclease family protein [Bryobacterales bacterium]|nr:PD-(D/E)XK nuclease family protein [Bryobacterales bacterium]